MSISQGLLPEFDHEMDNTRRVLDRVPEDKLDWRPHPKSGTMAWLASHVANLVRWAVMAVENDSFNLVPPDGGPPPRIAVPESKQQLLEFFEANVRAARQSIANVRAARQSIEGATDEQLMQPWSLLKGTDTVFTMPKVAVLRGVVMNHLIHHRGELCVYLRLNDVPVPGIYGPSADESSF